MFTNSNMSHIVSYNYTQTFKSKHLITLLKSYAAKFWPQSYFSCNMMKYEVTLQLVVNFFFLFFKHLNNTRFQVTQNLVILNTTNPFFTCRRQ
jgi:hypothetical protein